MKQSTSRFLLSAAALLQSVRTQQVPAIAGTGLDPLCTEDGLHTIVYEYPVFYSTVYESVGTIFNFLGGTNSLVVNNPGQTIITSTILTTTVVTTSTTTATVTNSGGIGVTATLGAGIASGTVSVIPSSSPFALAFIVDAVGGKRPKGFASEEGTGGAEDADFFYLQDDELRSTAGGKVGRNSSQTYAKIVASEDANDITTTFTLVDGALRWDSTDRGRARFYECFDGLYAGFPDAPFSNCTEALIGAIAKVAVDAELGIGGTSTSQTAISSTSNRSSTGSVITTSSGSSSMTTSGSSTARSSTSGSTNGTSSSVSSSTSRSGSSSSTTRSASLTMTSSSTTSSGAVTTTTSGGDGGESICPGADPEDDYFGYSVYCGQAVDPVNAEDELIPGGEKDVASFDDCTILCDTTEGCTGLSYFAAGTTCYIHGGESMEPRDAPGYDGAIRNDAGDGGDGISSTTSTTNQASSTTSGGAGTTTSGSGTSSSASAGSTTSSGASSTTSDTGGSTTSAVTTTSGTATTTTSTGTSTTTMADLCPTPSGSISGGYQLYCGYVVDPVDNLDNINPPSLNVGFQACLDLCTANSLCVGLSYIESSTTCYLHKGQNKPAEARSGWRGAIKVGAGGPSTSTTTTTSDVSTTTSTGASTTTSSGQSTTTSSATSTTAGASSTTTTTTTTTSAPTTTSAATTTTTTSTTTTSTTTTTTTTAASNPNPADSPANRVQCLRNCPTQGSVVRDGYQIYDGKGINGQNIDPPQVVANFEACIDLCNATTGCVSVSFQRSGGTCYMHSTCHDTTPNTTNPPTFDSAERVSTDCVPP